ncbi:hypothetical protein BU23DRAFT_578207 [Bimuria novae-zelandiae CBS 107.79]|uniref:DUF4110 domain-containing protein n=1 Tax=Bimuria novae-zelandiae CBS 107.79 TaxID=1447943 RepID=A0A6A5VIR5_9PLEO|nr:hypothetical protein BU23DRAFT_578207 [Bimuria novae-zelandiae CBS 107.79]
MDVQQTSVAAAKAAKATKQEKEASKKDKKLATKTKDVDLDTESVDLNKVLVQYVKEQEYLIIGNLVNNNKLFLYSSEYYNSAINKVTSPNLPLPRSRHAWCRAKLDLQSRKWTRIKMLGFKQYIILFGSFQDTSASTKGYSRIRTAAGGKQQQQGKGKKQQSRGGAQCMVLKPKERRKRPANTPNLPHPGAIMAFYKGCGIMFSGVHDANINCRDYARVDKQELLANLKALEMKAGGITVPTSKNEEEKEKEQDEEGNTCLEKPRDTLYIYGGMFEKGDREFTFDKLWSLNLNYLVGVVEIFKRELEDWQGSEDEADFEDDKDEYSDEEDNEDDEDKSAAASIAPTSVTDLPLAVLTKDTPEEDIGTTEEISALTDTLPHPRPFESHRAFYERTYGAAGQAKTPKEIKKAAFNRAKEKLWDCREEIRALEDEQEAAGASGGGVGRRR